MAEPVTIARPYAMAAFEFARDNNALARWSEMLAFMVGIVQDERMQAVMHNPRVTKDEVERALLAICGERVDGAARNLLTLLVRNDRLEVLPAVQELFEQLKAAYEKEVEASIDSAFPLSEQQLGRLVQRLETRTKRKVKATVNVTPELIGGVRVRVGDEVWDASVRAQLDTMATALTR